MAATLALRAGQRRKLLDYYRHHPDPAVRVHAHIILLLADGHSWATIGDVLFASASTIARWQRRFKGGGAEALLHRPLGSRAKWSDRAEAILRQALEHSPDELGYLAVNWTVKLLREHIEQEWGHKPTDLQVRRELRRPNYVWKRPGLELRGAKSPRVQRRLRLIRQKVRSLPPGCATLF
jgi:transposase